MRLQRKHWEQGMWHYTYYIILPLWNVGIFLLFFTYMALFCKRIPRRGFLRRRSVVYNIISLFRLRSCFFLFIIIISPSTWPKKREKRGGKGKQLDKKKKNLRTLESYPVPYAFCSRMLLLLLWFWDYRYYCNVFTRRRCPTRLTPDLRKHVLLAVFR